MTIEQHRRSVLARAARAALYHAAEGDKAGGDAVAGGDDKDKKADADKSDKGAGGDQQPKPDKTQADIDAAVKSALADYERKQADKAKRDADEREAEEAKKRGEFETVAAKERDKREAAEAERDAARLDKRKLEVKDRLRDYLAEKHPAYAAAAKWMMPAVEFDLTTDDKDIDKRIAAAADAYVKDNPRQTGGGGAPGQTGRGMRAAEGEKPKDDKSAANGREREYSLPARRGF